MNFDQAYDRLMGYEGGYSNHPNDPGGETMWGVTARVAHAAGYAGPMRDLTRDTAKAIYRAQYWAPIKAEQLPAGIRFDVFDVAVNSGVRRAVLLLQEAVGTTQDGVIGPKTLVAAMEAGPSLAARYNALRLLFMTDLANWPSFGKGWARRVARNILEGAA